MAFVTPVVENRLEREIAQWIHPMKDLSDDPLHNERTLLPQSYISLYNHAERNVLIQLNIFAKKDIQQVLHVFYHPTIYGKNHILPVWKWCLKIVRTIKYIPSHILSITDSAF